MQSPLLNMFTLAEESMAQSIEAHTIDKYLPTMLLRKRNNLLYSTPELKHEKDVLEAFPSGHTVSGQLCLQKWKKTDHDGNPSRQKSEQKN